MNIDPFRLAIAIVPLAAYSLVLAFINLRCRPFLTSGGSDLAALGLALTGVVFVGPLELFRPEAATVQFGNYIWLFLVTLYWLWLILLVLLARPRLVVYNISAEELHPILAEAAIRVDPGSRWAGNHLSLPQLGVNLHLDSFDLMRNVSLVASGRRQNIDGWRRLSRELSPPLLTMCVKSNPRAVSFLLVSLLLLGAGMAELVRNPAEIAQAVGEVFAH